MDQPRQGNGMAVAGLVCGIAGVVLCIVPVFGWVLALLGIIFGAIGSSKGKKIGAGKGMADAGLALGILGLMVGIGLFYYAYQEASRHSRYGAIVIETRTAS